MNQAIESTLPALCETVQARPRAAAASQRAATLAPASSSVTPGSQLNTQAALRASGIARLRVMALSMVLLCVLGVTVTALMDGPLLTKRLAWCALIVLGFAFASAWHATEGGLARRDHELVLAWAVVPVSLAVVVANFAFGPISGFCAAVTLGLVLFSSSAPQRIASLSYWTISVGYASSLALDALLHTGIRPLLPFEVASRTHWWCAVVGIELLYFAAHAAGTAIANTQARLVLELERAVREAAQRDALLAEAREALKQGAGIGGPGRFTDQEIEGFRLGPVIGRGGMGEVYAAERLSDGEPSAVKLLRVDFWGEKPALARFAREAKIAASIDSPHVVRVLEVSSPDSVCPYIAMERLAGADLGTHLRDRGRMNLEDVVEMVEQLASGLEVAHAASIIHRDLKPQNVFRAAGARGIVTWKILDFGVSKLLDASELSLTAAEIVGTPQYMAPEQARGERDLDSRVDVYALSAIAYRALTGEAPFRGELHSILRAILEEMPESPRSRARLPEDMDLVLALGLAKKREDRFANAQQLAEAFAQAARGALDPALKARAQALLAEKPYRVR